MPWTVSEGVNYEVACETINHMIALCTSAIDVEERKAEPNAEKLDKLEAECRRLARERDQLSPTDPGSVQRAIDHYAPMIRQHLGVDGKPHVA
jgi:hypothetical protein